MKYFATTPLFPPPELPDIFARSFLEWSSLPSGEPYSGPYPHTEHELAPLIGSKTDSMNYRLHSTAAWMRKIESVRPVLDEIYSGSCRVWAWKGLDYAQSLYDFPGGRPMCDFDLMVEKKYMEKVTDIFLRGGWQLPSQPESLFSCGIIGELKLFKRGVLVEIHTHPFYFPSTYPGSIPDDLFDSGRELLPGLFGFRWEYALLLSFLHHCQQRVSRQVWWIDEALITRMMAKDKGDWSVFASAAASTHLGREFAEILDVIGDLPGVSIPSGLASLLRISDQYSTEWLDRLRGSRGSPSLQNLLSLSGWKRISFLFEKAARIISEVMEKDKKIRA